jgi:hypothetical protein
MYSLQYIDAGSAPYNAPSNASVLLLNLGDPSHDYVNLSHFRPVVTRVTTTPASSPNMWQQGKQDK